MSGINASYLWKRKKSVWPGEGRRGFKVEVTLIQPLGSAKSLQGKEEKGEVIPEEHTPEQ